MTEHDNEPLRFEQEERLPWLEPIDDVEPGGASVGRLIGLVIVGLGVIGLVVGGLWWWQNGGGRPRGELIAAPEGNYKVTPAAEPGRFDGDGNASVAATEGVPTTGTVDPARMPEQPKAPPPATPAASPATEVAKSGATTTKGATPPARTAAAIPAPAAPAGATVSARPAPAFSPAVATAAPRGVATAAPAPAPAPASGTIQLGAFASEATAARAWDSLKARFTWLAPVNRSIVPATVNGRTVYRLRANAGTASAAEALCARFRVAGENCNIVR